MTKHFSGLAVLFLAAAVTAPASAQDASRTFLVEQGNWWISRLGTESCIAHNRPLPEFNAVPFNAVALQQATGERQPLLQALYWPKSFEAGVEFDLLIVPSSGKPFQYPVRAERDRRLRGLAPRTEAEFGKPAVSTTVTLGGDATPQARVVDTKELDEVAVWLDECTSVASPDPEN